MQTKTYNYYAESLNVNQTAVKLPMLPRVKRQKTKDKRQKTKDKRQKTKDISTKF